MNKRTVARAKWYREKGRWFKLKRLYGLSKDAYVALLKGQGDTCALCESKRFFRVDHDHSTGKVRGILCMSCNVRLGWFERRSNRIKEYITR